MLLLSISINVKNVTENDLSMIRFDIIGSSLHNTIQEIQEVMEINIAKSFHKKVISVIITNNYFKSTLNDINSRL